MPLPRHKLCLCVVNHQTHNCVTVDLSFLITHGFAHQLRNFLHVIKVTAELKRNAVSSFFKLLRVSDEVRYVYEELVKQVFERVLVLTFLRSESQGNRIVILRQVSVDTRFNRFVRVRICVLLKRFDDKIFHCYAPR